MACLSLEFCLWGANKKKKAVMTAAEIEDNYTEDQLREMEERSPLTKFSL